MTRDKGGKPYTVRYNAVNAMLLNEFLKEHRKNEEQQAIIERQQQQIEALTAGLQKVSAEIELNKTETQTALNNQQAIRLRAAFVCARASFSPRKSDDQQCGRFGLITDDED